MDRIVEEIGSLHQELEGDAPTLREKAAASQFLGSVYMGVENIFRRIVKHYGLDLPAGENWHATLFQRFRPPATEPLPVLLPDELAEAMKPFRGFRHVERHGYSLDLEWERMRIGLAEARPVFERFREQVEQYLDELGEEGEHGDRM